MATVTPARNLDQHRHIAAPRVESKQTQTHQIIYLADFSENMLNAKRMNDDAHISFSSSQIGEKSLIQHVVDVAAQQHG